MILQELIETFAKPRRRNTTLTIYNVNFDTLEVCGTDDVPDEYLNLTIIDWDFETNTHDDGETIRLLVDLEVRVKC